MWKIFNFGCLLAIFVLSFSPGHLSIKSNNVQIKKLQPLLPREITEITDPFGLNMIEKLQRVDLQVPNFISDTVVPTSFAFYPSQQKNLFTKNKTPLVLLHGFDSSSLEYRRLVTQLSDYDVYALDLLGWGFTGSRDVKDFGPSAKLQHIKSFIEQVVKQPCVLVGASLGGGIAINFAVEIMPSLVSKLVLIDPQGFVDGQGKTSLPRFIGDLGIKVLKARWLRQYATKLSYFDPEMFATDQAVKIGSVHCFSDFWDLSNTDFLFSGGFVTSPNIPKVSQSSLVIWGDSDKVIDISNAYKFERLLPQCTLRVIKDCGHVPHIEKHIETAQLIREFI